MRYEYTLGSTLFVFIMSLLMVVLGTWDLIVGGKLFVTSISCIVFMSPVLIFSGVILFKMWKRKTTKIYKDV